MKITGKTVERPSLDYMYDKYRGLLDKLQELIPDLMLFQEVQHYLIHLEWCDLFYELIPDKEFSRLSILFSEFEKLGIGNELVELSRASLEEVFLKLTGRRLRD